MKIILECSNCKEEKEISEEFYQKRKKLQLDRELCEDCENLFQSELKQADMAFQNKWNEIEEKFGIFKKEDKICRN